MEEESLEWQVSTKAKRYIERVMHVYTNVASSAIFFLFLFFLLFFPSLCKRGMVFRRPRGCGSLYSCVNSASSKTITIPRVASELDPLLRWGMARKRYTYMYTIHIYLRYGWFTPFEHRALNRAHVTEDL